jgi:hypothetical protein
MTVCENKMQWRLFGPTSNGFNGKIGILSDNLTGCTGFVLFLGGCDVLQKGIQSFTEFWFVLVGNQLEAQFLL